MDEKQVVAVDEHDPSVHHEESDVNISATLIGIGIFVLVTAAMYLGVWFLFQGYRRMERDKDLKAMSEVAGAIDRQTPPTPHLQPFPEPAEPRKAVGGGSGSELTPTVPRQDPWTTTPVADLVLLKKHYDEELHSYGWVDRNRGLVHIPIAEAKAKLLQRGLPSRGDVAAAPAVTATAAPATTTAAPSPTAAATTPAPATPATATEAPAHR